MAAVTLPSRDVLFVACAIVLGAALILGGGTRPGLLSDFVLQSLALPLLALAVWRLLDNPSSGPPRSVLLFGMVLFAIPLLQLLPLPPIAWTALPYRETEQETYQLLRQQLPWMPLSLTPMQTTLSGLSLIVPLSIFLGAAQLGHEARRVLTLIVLGVATVGMFLGLSQVALGQAGALRFHDITNLTEATGFFANRNHFAALLYCAFLFAAAWAIEAALASGKARGGPHTIQVLALAAAFTLMVAFIAAQAMARSRAGLVLAIVALLGALPLAIGDRRRAFGLSPARVLGSAFVVATVFAAQFALWRIMQRFTIDPLQDARLQFGHTTFDAAVSLMPAGGGMGSFVPVYGLFEKPQQLIAYVFANRAHNDALEFALETGALSLLILGAFMVWYVARSFAVWRSPTDDAAPIDSSLTRAATVIIALLLVHSVVDYPLRTAALGAVFALACAFLIEPRTGSTQKIRSQTQRHEPPSEVPRDRTAGQPIVEPSPQGRRWGSGIEWPTDWQRKS